MKKILFFLLILTGFIAVFNLFHVGFPLTHDGNVHLMRITGFYESLQQGIFIPRWAAHVNWGYGQPVFEFFYPLSSYIASLLHVIGFSFADSLKMLLGLSLILSGITMYLWLSKLTNSFAAFVGGFLYMFAPYRFVDIYVRGDIGESMGLVFVPLVLLFLTTAAKKEDRMSSLFAGISLAFLILSHNIVSLMALPFILFYAFYIWFYVTGRDKFYILRVGATVFFGFALSAFFWIPGLFEGKYTLRDIVTKGEYLKRFVTFPSLLYGPWNYGGSGTFTVQLGVLQWVALLSGVLALPYFFRKKWFFLLVVLDIYAIIAILLMLPISKTVWSHSILLQNFQFPWRFLLITTFSTAVIGALLSNGLSSQKMKIGAVIFLIAFICLTQYTYWQAKGYTQKPDNSFAGTINAPSDTGESSPIWSIRFMEHGFTNPLEVISGTADVTKEQITSIKHIYTVRAKSTVQVLENTLYFPGWQVKVDGKSVPVEFQNANYRGLMIFSVPQGVHRVQVIFSETKFRLFADYLSLLSFSILVLLMILKVRGSLRRL